MIGKNIYTIKVNKRTNIYSYRSKKEELGPPDHYAEEIIRGGKGYLSDKYIQNIESHIQSLSRRVD